MKTFIKILLITFGILFMNSCNLEEKRREKRIRELFQQNKKIVSEMKEKHEAINFIDLSDYTYKKQEVLIDNRRPLSFVAEIDDIFKDNDQFFLKLNFDYRLYSKLNKHFVYPGNLKRGIIKITNKEFFDIKNIIEKEGWTKEVFILRVDRIKPNAYSVMKWLDDDDAIFINYDEITIFEGILIDFHLFELPSLLKRIHGS